MSTPEAADVTWRVERGQPTEEELAALALTLMSRLAAPAPQARPAPGPRSLARWRRTDRTTDYRSPQSWRD